MSGLILCAGAATASLSSNSFNETLEGADALETITVEAEKLPRSGSDVTSAITLIDDQRMERELVQNLTDLVRYEPGVNVVDQGSRFGLAGLSIRGVGGNRVKIEVDGVATSDAFSIGSFSNASRDFVDLDGLKQVEIIRGPASAVFGSDALGGVVSFVTKGPQDILQDKTQRFEVSTGYNSVDASNQVRVAGALRAHSVSAMVRATVRHGAEREIDGSDPLDDSSVNLFARVDWGDIGNGALSLSVERFAAESVTQVDSLEGLQDFSAAFGFPFVVNTTEVIADDRRERQRISLGQEWLNGALGTDYLRWRSYLQNSVTRQDTFESRDSLSAGVTSPVARDRHFSFEQDLVGIEVNAASDLDIGGAPLQLAYGFEYEKTQTTQLRDGLETDLLTGLSSAQVGPDLFPLRDFPRSKTQRAGAYLQARTEIGALTLTPGLRWDRYALDPQPDAIFTAGNPGITSVEINESKFSPKLGLLWRFNPAITGYAQYSAGFRAPPVNDVNVGFTNFQFGYTTLPNAELASESSQGYELGVRARHEGFNFEVAGFQTEYADFIESFQVVGFDGANQLLQFQSINVEEVQIRGVELKANYVLPWLADQLSVGLALAYADGENEATGQALNSVAPLNGVIGLDFVAADSRWGASVRARGAKRQTSLDESDGELFQPGGFVVFDSFGFWQPRPDLRFRAGLYNLGDRNYTEYLDVQGQLAESENLSRFRQPGRHFSLALDWSL